MSSVERLLRAPTGAEAQDGHLLQRRDPDSSALELSAFDLADRVDGRVVILRLDPSAPTGGAPSRTVVDTLNGGPLPPGGPAVAALVDPPARGTAVRLENGDSALVITPLFKGDHEVGLLATQKRLTDVATAVAQVRRAFLAAALVGLGVAHAARRSGWPRPSCAACGACARRRCRSPATARPPRRRRGTRSATRSATWAAR